MSFKGHVYDNVLCNELWQTIFYVIIGQAPLLKGRKWQLSYYSCYCKKIHVMFPFSLQVLLKSKARWASSIFFKYGKKSLNQILWQWYCAQFKIGKVAFINGIHYMKPYLTKKKKKKLEKYHQLRIDVLPTFEPRHDKTNKMDERPAKAQISFGIHPVWSGSSLSAWRKLGSI